MLRWDTNPWVGPLLGARLRAVCGLVDEVRYEIEGTEFWAVLAGFGF